MQPGSVRKAGRRDHVASIVVVHIGAGVGDEAGAVGHLDLGQGACVHDLALIDNVCFGQDEGGERVGSGIARLM
jgi:hypothetical protein